LKGYLEKERDFGTIYDMPDPKDDKDAEDWLKILKKLLTESPNPEGKVLTFDEVK
jgi:hypothetical protein